MCAVLLSGLGPAPRASGREELDRDALDQALHEPLRLGFFCALQNAGWFGAIAVWFGAIAGRWGLGGATLVSVLPGKLIWLRANPCCPS